MLPMVNLKVLLEKLIKGTHKEKQMDTNSRNPIQNLIRDLPSHIIWWGMALLSLYLALNKEDMLLQGVSFVLGITMLLVIIYSFVQHIEEIGAYFEAKLGKKLQNKRLVLFLSVFMSALPLLASFYITHLASLKYSSEFLKLVK